MANCERLLAIFDRRSPDRVSWIPRLIIWHTINTNADTLPD